MGLLNMFRKFEIMELEQEITRLKMSIAQCHDSKSKGWMKAQLIQKQETLKNLKKKK